MKTLDSYQFPHVLREGAEDVYDNPTVCYLCNLVIDLVIEERVLGLTRETLIKEAHVVCTHLNIETDRVCTGIIELYVVSRESSRLESVLIVLVGPLDLRNGQLWEFHVEQVLRVCLAIFWLSPW